MWQFNERHHPHSLWHGNFLEKVPLTDLDRTAYQLTLLDDYSRGYVFCDLFLDPDMRTTVRALIAAMRQWRVVLKAVIFDNGVSFKGRLLVAFCKNVGIRLIHSAVRGVSLVNCGLAGLTALAAMAGRVQAATAELMLYEQETSATLIFWCARC